MKKTTVIAAIVASSTALASLAAFAHGGATGIVKERMDAMADMGKAVKAVTPMMRGEVAYDADVVRQAAAVFSSNAGEAMTDLFPEGTGGEPSKAKDTVWSKWEEFSELAQQLKVVSDGLAGAAENGLKAASAEAPSAGTMMGGSSAMMGGSASMLGGDTKKANDMTAEQIAAMSVDDAFAMVTQSCSACHTQYRAESQ